MYEGLGGREDAYGRKKSFRRPRLSNDPDKAVDWTVAIIDNVFGRSAGEGDREE